MMLTPGDHYFELHREIVPTAQRASCSLFMRTAYGPELVGTGTLARLDGRLFILTAAHVVAGLRAVDVPLAGSFVELGARVWSVALDALPPSERDTADVAVMEVAPDLIPLILKDYSPSESPRWVHSETCRTMTR